MQNMWVRTLIFLTHVDSVYQYWRIPLLHWSFSTCRSVAKIEAEKVLSRIVHNWIGPSALQRSIFYWSGDRMQCNSMTSLRTLFSVDSKRHSGSCITQPYYLILGFVCPYTKIKGVQCQVSKCTDSDSKKKSLWKGLLCVLEVLE